MVRGSTSPPSAPEGGALANRPNLLALISLAHTLCEAGRVHEAEELCRLILREQPGLAAAQAALGRCLFDSGRLDAAEQWLERTVRQTPGCFAAYRWLGEVLLQKGIPDRAYAVLAQAAVMAPDNPRIQQLLASITDRSGGGGTSPPPGAPIQLESEGPPPFRAPPMQASIQVDTNDIQVEVDDQVTPPPRRPRTEEYPPWPAHTRPVFPIAAEDIVTPPPQLPLADYSAPMVQARAASSSSGRVPTQIGYSGPRVQSPIQDYSAAPVQAPLEDFSAPPSASYSAPPPISVGRPRVPSRKPRRPLWSLRSVRAVTGLVAALVAVGLVFAVVIWVQSGGISAASLSGGNARLGRPARPSPAEASARRTFEAAIEHGGLRELSAATQTDTSALRAPELVSADAFAAALLASEYGLPVAAETRALADAVLTDDRLKSELAAARVLFALAKGDLPEATRAAQGFRDTPWLAYAQARLARVSGAQAGADGAPGIGAATVLAAEGMIDDGAPDRAVQLLESFLARAPTQARARLALAEARAALGVASSADEIRELRTVCSVDSPRSLVIEAGCALSVAEELRRKGQRLEARTFALKVASLAPPEPRLLARTAQLLLNLGETRRAEALIVRARSFASPSYPPLTWAILGARINRGAVVDPQRAPLPAGPESRLLAVRGALAREGAAGVQKSLQRIRPAHVSADPDLGWFAMLPKIQRPRTAVRLAQRYATADRPPPGPVGSYVLGLLARWGGRRPLAARWLAQARAGHGDACSAMTLQTALVPRRARRGAASAAECDPRLAPDLDRPAPR